MGCSGHRYHRVVADEESTTFGPNEWLVEEMYDQYKADPELGVGQLARVLRRLPGAGRPAATARRRSGRRRRPPAPGDAGGTAAGSGTRRPLASAAAPQPEAAEEGAPIRGAAARIVANMEASLGVPTATSVRVVPAKLLEVNRKILNNHLGRTRGGKVSFTHIIGYAIVRAARARCR